MRVNAPAIGADTLARNIGMVVRRAEAAHKGPQAARLDEVQTAVQDLIAIAAPPPSTVKSALEHVLASCSTRVAAQKDGLDCPSDANSYVALRNLLAVVTGLAKEAAGDTNNEGGSSIAPLPLPVSGGGGSNYRPAP